jgi:phosphoglycerate dehydrogenase-like enzyme
MLNCAILDDYQECSLDFADWASLKDVTLQPFTKFMEPEVLAKELQDFEIIIAMRERTTFNAKLLESLPKLKLLVTTGMKNSAIDMDAAKQHGIAVCGTKSLPYPAPELTWGLLFAIMRHIPMEVASLRSGGWQTQIGVGLNGKTLGIVGLGHIGKQIAKVAQALEMSVLAWQPKIKEDECKAAGVECASSLEDLMRRSDAVTIHMVLADSTKGMIGAHELSLMKPTAFLVNAARGPLVDEEALVQALKENRIAGAALDVFDTEPLPADHPFRTLPNVIATPHLGYVTRENYDVFYSEALEDIKCWQDGTPLRSLSEPK